MALDGHDAPYKNQRSLHSRLPFRYICPRMKHLTLLLLSLVAFAAASFAQMDQLFYFPTKTLQGLDSVKYEDVSLPVDTDTLNAIFLKPTGKPKATVLFFHGAGGNVSKYLFMTKPLVADGFQVFMIDFRGYGKSTGKPTHVNIAQDGQMVLNYLLERKDVKKTTLILYGASMGSQVAVHLAATNEKKLAALVLDGALSSFTDLAADKSPEAQREMIRKHLLSPYAAKEDIKAIQNLPVLFIHSKEDKDVPYQQAELVYANAAGPKTFYTYQGKHLEAMKLYAPEVLEKINGLVK